jgi:hypothetical protein
VQLNRDAIPDAPAGSSRMQFVVNGLPVFFKVCWLD